MKESEVIIKRQKYHVHFKNEDMDFIFNWMVGVSQIVGMSPGQLFYVIDGVRDGDPDGWRENFRRQGRFMREESGRLEQGGEALAAGQASLGAAYAFRAALQFTGPKTADFSEMAGEMEAAFQRGVRLMGVPVRPIEVPFEDVKLPGYYLEHDDRPRPTLFMVGGGDTFREDLFYFAGYPGWKRGYNVLMVDLPGQGRVPDLGQHIRVDMEKPFSACLDWLEAHAAVKPEQVATYGVSAGGYFTALGVANDRRIKALVASTPITDMAELFRKEVGIVQKAPGWLLNTAMQVSGSLNRSSEINMEKYAWQFGTSDFKSAVDLVLAQAKVVNPGAINCPCLFLMGESEAAELQRQTKALHGALVQRGIDATLRVFTAAEGGDVHCQLNNLRLAHLVIFDWLDRVFAFQAAGGPVDGRLIC